MDILKLESEATLTREEAARRLHAIADTLARNNEIELDATGRPTPVRVRVPAQVRMKVEVELEDDEGEFEVELSWGR